MKPFKCLVTILGLYLGIVLAVPQSILEKQNAPDYEEIQKDESEAKGKKIIEPLQKAERAFTVGQSLDQARQALDQGIGLAQDKLEKVGKGIGNALGNLFGGFGGPSIGLKTPSKPAPGKSAPLYFKGGCTERPSTPTNANVKCSPNSGHCDVKCLDDFSFPDKSTQMQIRCEAPGVWKVTNWDRMPDCEPICMPPCQNLGFCLAPNVCDCPDNFEGPQCQFAKSKPCLDKPPTPMNSRVVCNEKECISTCNRGFTFPGGSKKLTLVCDAGNWVQRQQPTGKFQKVPDCQPVCEPPCANGGRCLPNNYCECPQEFRGPQCNYPVGNCAPERMNFNGGYNCSGGSASFSCSLNCGATGVFEFPPADLYSCEYAKAKFTPETIPQCIFESEQLHYFKSNSTSHSTMLIEQTSELEWNGQQQSNLETKWTSGSHQGFWGRQEYEKYFENFFSGGSSGDYSISIPEYSLIRETSARPGTCLAWGGSHYKTFDGKVYSVSSDCSYVLLRDAVASTFSIVYGVQKCGSRSHCKRFINILVEDFVYEIDTNGNNEPYIRKGDQSLTLPNQIDGLLFERVANFVVVQAEGLGFTVRWDTKAAVTIDVSDVLWNKTAGLCGRINGMWVDDFENRDGTRSSSLLGFVNSWEASGLTEQCQSNPNEKHACKWDTPEDQHVSNEATKMCEHILKDEKFEKCRSVVDPRSYYEACRWDYCQCANANREDCACSALETYFHECLRNKVELPDGWRDQTLCPINCDNGRVYKMCGPISDETCSGPVAEPMRATDLCIEGCYCPNDSALHKDQCIRRSECPCTLRKKTYQPGEQVPNDCNTCTCVAGQWQCTDVRCGSRCAVLGDPHYTTFDGHHYDFMGKCSYYLMKGDNYSIEAENVPCSGAISQAMNFPVKSLSTVPSCTKSVTIRTDGGDVIKLKQNREVTVNGEEVVLEPSVWIDGVVIRHASSVFLAVELPNGLEVWWDGLSRVYIDAPPAFYGTTKGLCGTFNENQRDDMTTPEGDVEQSVAAFANAWKTKEVCQDASIELEPTHPCEINGHNKAQAEQYCAKIKDAIFQSCHQLVDPEQYYRDCLYDVCACQVKLSDCLCPTIASYAKECAQKGDLIDWIPDVRECGVHCQGGQSYQVCGNSCSRTCHDIALYPKCHRKCVEGCNCPEGQTLDPFGQCIPVHECPCLHKGVEYPPGHKELRPGARSPDLCTCTSARWHCRSATLEERDLLANVTPSTQMQCRSSHNEEYTLCEPEQQLTCKTMDQVSIKKPVECRPGCQCKKGYIFDPANKTCIKPSDCPCHHAGRSFAENNRITQDCNTCTCRSGKWECTKNQCPGMCTNWGESHYKTFDGKKYDFHGNCDYMLAKGSGTEAHEKFQVTVQSVPCGSSGVACSKSVMLRLGSPGTEESITLTRHKKIPIGKFSERILVREAGLFIFLEVADLGLVLQWDHGTRLYLRLAPKWKGRVRGLCGNFNDNALDDFQSPSGGITEIEAKIFGDSWRLQKYCPESSDYIDTCTLHPHRKVWSVMKCSLLKSSLFEKCHAEVPVEYYVEKCVQDSCGCDMGGDCECLCTSFAEYAHECNSRGIPIKWRSQELCPLQCNEECSSYSSCMSTCPPVTCGNPFGSSPLCSEDACVEGCQPKACPRGQIHRSDKELSCMPISDCRSALCMVVDGVMYAEGDVIERDACHACYCSKGKRVCQGQPCYVGTTTAPPVIRTTIAREMDLSACRTGWSDWFNTHQPKDGADPNDIEPIPDRLHPGLVNAPVCSVDQMVDIECRAAATKISHKKTGDNVDCSIESGLKCVKGGIKGRSTCHDYEIRILCDCSTSETRKPIYVAPTTVTPAGGRCDPSRPNSPHPTDCYLFYQCVDRLNGVEQVEKTCNPPTMYNPNTMVCDWPEAVSRIRPECGLTATTTAAPIRPSTTPALVTGRCDPARPNSPHPTDCYLFYQCVDRLNGIEQVEKTCNPPTMYNPNTMVCDWSESVMKIRPECGSTTPRPYDSDVPRKVTTPVPVKDRCDPARPNSPHPTSCHLFYQCVDRLNRIEQVEKTCNPPTMYNPNTMVCDWPEAVLRIRPECGSAPATRKPPIEGPCVDGWTDWFSVSSPSDSTGDFEIYEKIIVEHPICPKSHIREIECKFMKREGGTKKSGPAKFSLVDYTSSPDRNVQCSVTDGLICYNSDQESGLCQDYKVRFMCRCEDDLRIVTTADPPTTEDDSCPEGYSWNTCAYSCNQLCLAFGSELKRRGYCLTSEGCAPGCVEQQDTDGQQISSRNHGCLPGRFWRDERTCVKISDCNCRTPYGKIIAPGSIDESEDNCEVCQCLDNEYICDNSRCQYKWTTTGIEVSRNISVVTTPKPRPPGPTTSPSACSAWSDWINEYGNTAWGDYESKTEKQLKQMGFCLNGKVVDIECRDAKNNRPWTETRDKDVICSLDKGLACYPARQGKGGRCQDYKIRYLCECFGGDDSLTTATPTSPPTTTIMIWTTPPKPSRRGLGQCAESLLVPLLFDHVKVPDSAFTATTSKKGVFGPSSARFHAKDSSLQTPPQSYVSWVAGKRDMAQHIQVDLGASVWVDGFEISGSPTANEYVTSLFVLYSEDNQRFSYVPNRKGRPKLFRGPLEHDGRKKNIFHAPIEARYIRLEPQTWKHAIALRFELLGCNATSDDLHVVTTPTPVDEVCNDQMGLENGLIRDAQLTLSSVNGSLKEIRLGSNSSWIPAINSRKENVKVDLREARNLSGIITQGHPGGHGWVESYAVRYSSDGETWFTVLNDDSSQRVFHANVDGNTPYTNLFERLIHARYLKIVPWSWHETIALRLEVLGCYLPVTIPEPLPDVATTPLPKFCHPCPNIPDEHLNVDHCACPVSQSWNGTGCVHPSQCPCFDGHTKYSVGSIFQAHSSCSQCVCRLGGVSDCRKPTCPPCSSGLLSSLSDHPVCQCSCKPCETGTRLCQSSNVCLDESLWCNGVEDCPDDERHCITTTAAPVECRLEFCSDGYTEKNTGLFSADGCPIYQCVPPASRPTGAPCPDPSCPPGFTLELQGEDYDEQQLGQLGQLDYEHLSQQLGQNKDYDQLSQQSSNVEELGQLHQSTDQQRHSQHTQNHQSCPPYKCVPEPKSTTVAPLIPSSPTPFIEREDRCYMTGRMFKTFDGTEYSYDICHHILMRDMLDDEWSVSVHKHCPANKHGCTRSLRIDHNKDIIEFLPNLQVAYQGFEYSVLQAEQIASMSPNISIHRVGDSVLFRSEIHDFWIVWDIHLNVKIGVMSKLVDHIDGLCGFYNLKPYDDQRTPTGELAKTTQEFGKSWSVDPHLESECAYTECPIRLQTAAWDKCSFLRQEPFTQCHGSDDLAVDKAIFRCVEVMCDCMGSIKDSNLPPAIAADRCACQAMSVMAVECHDANSTVDLSGWRSKYDCSIDCGSDGSVYKECNKKTCERSCQNNKNPHPCPPMPDLCYPGCVCPDGLVRHSDGKCVKPSECRDCVCDGFGDPHYITFDRKNVTFGGNCTYIAARDKLSKLEAKLDHDFQVLVTNKECDNVGKTSCTEAVTIMFQDHVINMRHSEPTHSVIGTLDGLPIETYPVHLPWMRMEKLPGEQISVLLMAIQVEVSYYLYSRGFKVRLPSQLYLNKTEGLCGNCNSEVIDDEFNDKLGLNWLASKLLRDPPNGEEELCQIAPQPECTPLDPSRDPCLKLLDSDIFKMCNAIVDPLPYIAACQYDTCKSADPLTAACPSFESYARECARYQVCLSWRSPQLCPTECPPGMEYRQCGSGCQSICEDKNALTCPMSVNDGCYCPAGLAFNQAQGRCVPLDHCEPCDSEGHYKGDHWKPDACTTCFCAEDNHVQCMKRSCTLDECPPGFQRTIIQPQENECCPTVNCLQEENLVVKKPCPEVPVPTCGHDQVLQFHDVNGCLHQLCDCIPFDQCPPLDSVAANPLVGVKYVVNTTGCCHHLDRICVPEDCPPKPDCPPFYQTEIKSSWEELCCPEYTCAPPKDVCIYEHTHGQEEIRKTASKGTKKTTGVKTVGKRSVQFRKDSLAQLYAINATWKDGPCLECVCVHEPNNPIPRTICTATSCPDTIDDDYVIKTEPVADACCPRLVRTACRQGNTVYQPGDTWPSPSGDPCHKFECLQYLDGSIIKQQQTESCSGNCPTGWEYQSSPTICCGTCQQVACVTEDGVQHVVNSTWKADPCTTSTCVSRDNGLQIESTRESCEEPTVEDRLLYVYDKIESQDHCCPTYRKIACLFNNKEYKVNDTWSPSDPCVSMVCVPQSEGQVARQEILLSCPPPSDCQDGYEHELPGPSECCGKCVQVACVLDGQLHPIGSSWQPNPCTFFSCVGNRGQAHIAEAQVICSPIGDCPEKNRVIKPGECCAICNATQSQKNCQPEELPLEKTVGYVIHSSVMHGKCTNVEPVHGLTECVGHCKSSTTHEPDSIDPTSNCECCQPEDTKELKTPLICADGKNWAQVIRVPTSCSCSPCIGSLVDNQPINQAEDLSQINQSSQIRDFSQDSQSSHAEDLSQILQQHQNQEEQQSLESLTQQVLEQLQKPEEETQTQILQGQRQGRGDVVPRNSGGRK